jgi:hypothetical protein
MLFQFVLGGVVFELLEIKPRDLRKHSTTKLHPQPTVLIFKQDI